MQPYRPPGFNRTTSVSGTLSGKLKESDGRTRTAAAKHCKNRTGQPAINFSRDAFRLDYSVTLRILFSRASIHAECHQSASAVPADQQYLSWDAFGHARAHRIISQSANLLRQGPAGPVQGTPAARAGLDCGTPLALVHYNTRDLRL
jgi:hypothetical protein